MNFDTTAIEGLPEQLLTLLTDPGSNLTAALVLYGLIAASLLVILLVVIMWLMSAAEDEHEFEEADEAEAASAPEAAPAAVAPQVITEPVSAGSRRRRRLIVLGSVIGIVLAAWVMAGFTTSATPVCESCHVDTPHSTAAKSQPHTKAECVECHEPGGAVGRYFGNVPARLSHFVDGASKASLTPAYGAVANSSCASCHKDDIAKITTNSRTGIRMSHDEPLEASAQCIDCHRLSEGAVASHNAGMNPCLRCHNSRTASSECSVCHDKKTASAARARSTSFAAERVPVVKCGGCHNEKTECDSCHGTRMPHTAAFMAGGHARAGAVNFWYEGGKTCSKCHTETRRPCTKCHTPILGKGHPASLAKDHKAAESATCNSCHQRFSDTKSRDFCTVCHSPLAESMSPR